MRFPFNKRKRINEAHPNCLNTRLGAIIWLNTVYVVAGNELINVTKKHFIENFFSQNKIIPLLTSIQALMISYNTRANRL